MKLSKKQKEQLGFSQGNSGAIKAVLQQAHAVEAMLAEKDIIIDDSFIKVTINGLGEVKDIVINKDLVDPDDLRPVELGIVDAMKKAFDKSLKLRQEMSEPLITDSQKVAEESL